MGKENDNTHYKIHLNHLMQEMQRKISFSLFLFNFGSQVYLLVNWILF